MNCSEFLTAVRDYCEQRFPAERMAEFRAHETACPPCGELLRVARETTCRDVADFLHDYVDGTLAAERRAIFERHMGICPECVDYMASYRRTIAAGKDACGCASEAPPVPERLVQAVLAARRAKPGGAPPA